MDVDIPSLDLSDRAAEAAFGLVEVLGGHDKLATLPATFPANEEEEYMKLKWDKKMSVSQSVR